MINRRNFFKSAATVAAAIAAVPVFLEVAKTAHFLPAAELFPELDYAWGRTETLARLKELYSPMDFMVYSENPFLIFLSKESSCSES